RPRPPGQDALDGGGAEVLAVHAQPLRRAAREVDKALLVLVGEVTAPVHAAPHALGVGGLVVVVALEQAGTGGVHQLTHGLVEVDHATLVVEPGGRHGLAGRRVEDGAALGQHAHRAARR